MTDQFPEGMSDWLKAVKLADTPLINMVRESNLWEREGDIKADPEPQTPKWLQAFRRQERAYEAAVDYLNNRDVPEGHLDDYDPLAILEAAGFIITITPPPAPPVMTKEQETEALAFSQEWTAWSKRHPYKSLKLTWGWDNLEPSR